jgi:hypothetical protein
LRGHLRQLTENRQTKQKPTRRLSCREPKCDPERVTLRPGKVTDVVQEGANELVQPGERKFHLSFDACYSGHPAIERGLSEIVQQGGLADAGLTTHDEDDNLTSMPTVPETRGPRPWPFKEGRAPRKSSRS